METAQNPPSLATRLRTLLPEGIPMPDDQWRRRHLAILTILWLHVVGVVAFALVRGYGLRHSLFEASLVTVFALVGTQSRVGDRRVRASATGLGLIASSAVLVHLSGGVIEMHFHFFVMIAVITLYHDWRVFLSAILFVALHHGVIGVAEPLDVYNHGAAQESPWKWAVIHAAFVLAASAAQVTSWRFSEDQFRRAEKELLARDRRFRSLIENSSDGISVIGEDGRLLYDSPSVHTILGYEVGERVGAQVFDAVHPDDVERVMTIFADLVSGYTDVASVELRAQHKDGTWRYIEARAKNLIDTPDVNGIVANFRDITERKKLEHQLEHRAFHDPLTELPNRALFLDRISHALATRRRTREDIGVLFIDLDDFKTVNDGLGHAAGDHVLTVVAQRLRACVRESDTCARLGGDEFGVLLEGVTGPAEVYDAGARILEALRDEIPVAQTAVGLNASLGIAVATDEQDPASLVRNADLAMYRAKSEGKGRYSVYEAGMHDAVVERLALKAELRRAVDAGEFINHYQPIVELGSGRVVGAEALVRWQHPERGLLAPGSFLDLAEETGLISAIGSAVLAQACDDAVLWTKRTGEQRGVSVNVSASQLKQASFVHDVASVLVAKGLSPSALTIEITESLLIEDPENASETLQRLKSLGVRIALDDFGTGYSSLSYLGRFPVDRLKIDKSFVDALAGGGSPHDVSLVSAIIGIGKMLDLAITAEGIEQHTQLTELIARGCELGQGYLFGRPVANEEFMELMSQPSALGAPPVPARS